MAIHDAIRMLRDQGFIVCRSHGEPMPPELLAVRRGEYLLIMVRQTRVPVPDVETVKVLYHEDLIRFRTHTRDSNLFKRECWVHAPPEGWNFFEVHPGGIQKISHDRWILHGHAGVGEEILAPNRTRRSRESGRPGTGYRACDEEKIRVENSSPCTLPGTSEPVRKGSDEGNVPRGYLSSTLSDALEGSTMICGEDPSKCIPPQCLSNTLENAHNTSSEETVPLPPSPGTPAEVKDHA